ncbi:hypothetical protein [Microbulbifer agarilyticus]|uniref:hypothetical protein n=1 Tax=Microbulbifer agarilyticus TaxID=260552 RepID=UPI001C93A3D0|nr:hypothetical protein [Microbulbifer agarilyticus]MBY6210613.1 hypothetical protein [Microbulbifer agarilyticus]MCA0891829.1 hypothetical protein [Microbulbifer agarilyticus]
MPAIDVQTVKNLLEGGGKIIFNRNNISPTKCSMQAKLPAPLGTFDNTLMAKATIADNTIKMVATKDNDLTANAVNVLYEDQYATTGSIKPPGYIFSDSFGGCSFYLFRGPMGNIHGAHASRGNHGQVTDPTSYFTNRGGTLLYTWHSKGNIPEKRLMNYELGAVLAVVNADVTDIFCITTKNQKVTSVISHEQVSNSAG